MPSGVEGGDGIVSDYFTSQDNMTPGSYSQERTNEALRDVVKWIMRYTHSSEEKETLGRLAVEWGLITEEGLKKISDDDLFHGDF